MIQNRLKALPGYSLYQRVADKARNASVSSHAGAAAFFMMLSFLPFTMFLLSLLPLPGCYKNSRSGMSLPLERYS